MVRSFLNRLVVPIKPLLVICLIRVLVQRSGLANVAAMFIPNLVKFKFKFEFEFIHEPMSELTIRSQIAW